jgi:hypothetical protein
VVKNSFRRSTSPAVIDEILPASDADYAVFPLCFALFPFTIFVGEAPIPEREAAAFPFSRKRKLNA